MSNLLKHIKEYFDTFNQKDYTIYVDGIPTECCKLNDYSNCVVWNIQSDSNKIKWYSIDVREIETIRLTPTTIEIIKTNGKEYAFTVKIKTKEEKVKDIILRVKNALYICHIDDALKYLDDLKVLMDE